jgi:predicted lipoprotein with Yx(FWY)xxD motif
LTLQVARHATVMDAHGRIVHEDIVVNAHARAVYELTGDSKRHPECTAAKGCFGVWPPVKVASLKKLSKAGAIRGRLGLWRRDGFLQVTLSGHPLYTFAEDHKSRVAHGEGIKAFGGTWHVLRPRRTGQSGSTTTTGAASSTTTAPSTATSTTPTTTTPPPCFYPPCP